MEYKGRKYRKLYAHLLSLSSQEWTASFADIEAIIGDHLPASAWDYQVWWANDVTHSQGAAWLAAGWETAQVDRDAETLLFRKKDSSTSRRRTFNAILPDRAAFPQANGPGVSRQDAVVRDGKSVTSSDALNALDQLQVALRDREVDLDGWARNMRAERRVNGL